MGLTNVEALACGTPVITFDTGGSVECIDENTGFVARKGNIDDLLNCIRKIKVKTKKLFIEKCVSRAKQLYQKEDRFIEYTNLYLTKLIKSVSGEPW